MRPTIAPAVLASLTESAPKRLVRKLDKDPLLAEAWSWSTIDGGALVTTDKDEQVRLSLSEESVTSVDALACTCLLSPRCLHVLAVASLLELAHEAAAPPPTAETTSPNTLDEAVVRSTAEAAWQLGARVLTAGAKAAGPMLVADLLRVVHSARLVGLHRLAAAGTRVVRGVRALRHQRGDLDPDQLSTDLYELLHVGWRLCHGPLSPTWLGSARRAYDDIGSLRLHGVFTEAIATRSGYAGVSTILIDDDGRTWSIADVRPGDGDRCRTAYASSVDLGGCTSSHRELSRAGLFVNHGRGTADGRLGAGQQVQATRAERASLFDTPFGQRFDEPFDEQCDRALRPNDAQRSGDDLLALRGTVVGLADGDLVALIAPTPNADEARWQPIRFVAPSRHPELHYAHNLARLAHAPGLRLALIARAQRHRPGTAELLAVAALPETRGFALPDAWQGRCNLGVDRLRGDHLITAERRPALLELSSAVPSDPLMAMRRRLHRLALGGHGTVVPSAAREVERDASRLKRRHLTTGAALLLQLQATILGRGRSLSGEREAVVPDGVARAWLAAMRYQQGASASLSRDAWLPSE